MLGCHEPQLGAELPGIFVAFDHDEAIAFGSLARGNVDAAILELFIS